MKKTNIPTGKIVQASFFWRNDCPDGLGFTLQEPAFSSDWLTQTFTGSIIKKFLKDSDESLGTKVVSHYLDQLQSIARESAVGHLNEEKVLLAALNILWLTERGFIPNDEYNGVQFAVA